MNSEELKITTIEELQRYGAGTVISFPPFAEGQPFVAKVKRPSMLGLMKSGKIPNSLLVEANKLFANGAGAIKQAAVDKDGVRDLLEVVEAVCDACFVEPTYQQIKDAGVELTDEQKMFAFSYVQAGVKVLESFRQ